MVNYFNDRQETMPRIKILMIKDYGFIQFKQISKEDLKVSDIEEKWEMEEKKLILLKLKSF